MAKQVRPDLALFEWRQVNAPSTRRAKIRPGWSCASIAAAAEIVTVADQHVEGIELDLCIVLAAVQAVEVGTMLGWLRKK